METMMFFVECSVHCFTNQVFTHYNKECAFFGPFHQTYRALHSPLERCNVQFGVPGRTFKLNEFRWKTNAFSLFCIACLSFIGSSLRHAVSSYPRFTDTTCLRMSSVSLELNIRPGMEVLESWLESGRTSNLSYVVNRVILPSRCQTGRVVILPGAGLSVCEQSPCVWFNLLVCKRPSCLQHHSFSLQP